MRIRDRFDAALIEDRRGGWASLAQGSPLDEDFGHRYGQTPVLRMPRSYLAFEMTTTINPDDRLDAGAALALLPGIAYALGVHDADETLTLLADALRERRALHGLCWHDAVNVAAAIAFDCSARYDVADYLALRAIRARDGSDAMPWRDRQAVACAFALCAGLLGLEAR